MSEVIADADLLRVRMHALGLSPAYRADAGHGDPVSRVRAVVAEMFAMQGQDWRASQWAVGVRAPGTTATDVARAMDAGAIVRSWPMRGTVHLVCAEDIGWMQQLTNPKALATAPKRRQFLGISDATLELATEVSVAALTGSAGLSRDELAAAWTEAGIFWQPNWRYHLIWWLCQTGLATFGPVAPATADGRPGGPKLVLAREWIPAPRALTGDDALAEFAARYVRGRGAVTRKDLASWALLPAASASRGLALAAERGAVVTAQRAGMTGAAAAVWVSREALEATASPAAAGEPRWQLLPAFDEHLLGFSERSPQFRADNLQHVVPGRNGMFLPTVVRDGRAVGTWRRDRSGHAVTVTAFPGEHLDAVALEQPLRQWETFSGESGLSISVA